MQESSDMPTSTESVSVVDKLAAVETLRGAQPEVLLSDVTNRLAAQTISDLFDQYFSGEQEAETMSEVSSAEDLQPETKPLQELGQEGTRIHANIQQAEIEAGRYDRKEVPVTDGDGNVLQRQRIIERGPRAGDFVYEGSRYDVYRENGVIRTAEIKPFTDQGVYQAEKKLELQKELEEELGGNKGKPVERELILYDPETGEISMRGPYDTVLADAQKQLSL